MRRVLIWLPLLVFAVFVVTLAAGLYKPAETVIRSQMVGRQVPGFALPAALPEKPGVDSAGLASGHPRLVNIFASWCVPCIAEAPRLMALAGRGVPIDAIAIRDRPENVARFLDRWGNPYQRIGLDRNSKVQLALGSSGVPETFIVDGRGIIRYQHIGEIRSDDIALILAEFERAR